MGKTSLGKSIARALGRKFSRISMGGMHDEAEIRGHRRTYIGSLPGQVIQALRRAGANDPVFMLDEVDKLGRDFRGDPASALLEVLDPEQNSTFRDNYLDVPFDLSQGSVHHDGERARSRFPMRCATAWRSSAQGYTEQEKVIIAFRYLIPRQNKENGLDDENGIVFTDEAVRFIVRRYTREAGVRNLEREIGTICRKQARRIAEGGSGKMEVTPQSVEEPIWARRVSAPMRRSRSARGAPGVAVGLAWTPVGGDVLFIEAGRMPGGNSGLIMTGQLGSGDAGIGAGRADLGAQRGDEVRHRSRSVQDQRHSHPRAGGRDSEGRAFGGNHHGERAAFDADRTEGASRISR